MTEETVWTEAATLDSICVRLVYAIGRHLDTDPYDLTPLHDFIDPDALAALFRFECDNIPRTGAGFVEFAYEDLDITLFDDGTVTIVDTVDDSLDESVGASDVSTKRKPADS